MRLTALLLLCSAALCAQPAVVMSTHDVPRVASCVAIDADLLAPEMRMTRDGFTPASLWGRQTKFWPQRATLRIKFLDGSRSQLDRAWTRFAKVDVLVNLTFVKSTGESEIRVSFAGQGHWSYVGKDCLTIQQAKPTMNLQLTSWDSASEWDRVAIHELLHALGCRHEHQHPQGTIPWNVPAVITHYRQTQGWSEATTRRQVLNRETVNDFYGSGFDPASIMLYPIDRSLVTDPRYVVGWNRRLSVTDIAQLKRIYP